MSIAETEKPPQINDLRREKGTQKVKFGGSLISTPKENVQKRNELKEKNRNENCTSKVFFLN